MNVVRLAPLALLALACSKEPASVTHPGTPAPAVDASPDAAPSSAPSATPSASLGGLGGGDGPFAGGACSTDADCQAFYDCCMFVAQCGTKANAKKQNEACSCCVSCPAPRKPPPLPTCGCIAGTCAARP